MANDNPSIIVNSSSIRSYSYDVSSQTLVVQFVGADGDDHVYSNVTPDVISKVFDSGGSVGSKFHKLIKQGGFSHKLKAVETKEDA